MVEQILEMITTYGLETVAIALIINVLTGFVKMPIKSLANKLKDYTKVTRFIVFLPVGFGFFISYLYVKFIKGAFNFDRDFVTLWLTSSSLSLTFYAIFEKLFPSKKKIFNESEIKASEKILTDIKQILDETLNKGAVEKGETVAPEEETSMNTETAEELKENKIILRGKSNAEINVEK